MRNVILTISIIFTMILTSMSVEARQVTINDVEPLVKNFVIDHYSPLYKGDIKVQCGRMAGLPFDAPDGKLEIKIKSVLRDTFVPRTVIRVSVYVDGEFQKAFGVPLTLSLHDNVWVATQPIQRDDAISGANVTVSRRDISKLAHTAARTDSDLSGTRVKKSFSTGEILDHRFIEKDPIVIRNALVEVIFQSRTVSISIPGQALENGNMGDIIKVRSREFRKDYVGKVIDRGLILVNI